MQDTKFYYIPRRLNEPYRVVVFTWDEFIPATGAFMLLFMLHSPLIGLALSFVTLMLIRHFKAGRSRDYFKRKLFWMGLNFLVKNQNTRNTMFFKGTSQFHGELL